MSDVVRPPTPVAPRIVRPTQLPSRGLLYEGKLPDGNIEMTPMRTTDEKLMAGGFPDRAELINTLIKRCLVTDVLPFQEYLMGDKFYMLMFLRNISYGSGYEFRLNCDRCGTDFLHSIEIPADMSIRVLTEDDIEPYEVGLSVEKKKVELRQLRVADEIAIQGYTKQHALRSGVKAQGDPAYMFRMSRSIVTIDGKEVSPVEALSFCEKLYGQDSLAIRNTLDDHQCGVDLMLDLSCPQCGKRIEEMMPFTTEFFRPKSA